MLRDDQAFISDSFAGRSPQPDGDKFACTRWIAGESGLPRIAAGLAAFDCRLQSSQRVDTHHVLIGAVQDIHVAAPGTPLIYSNRSYHRPAVLMPARHTG